MTTDSAGIVIVAYNSEQFLGPCLEAALAHCEHVVVVDNASADRTLSVAGRYPAARVIANSANRGFAAAANQGIRVLGREYVLLLNPDAILRTPLGRLVDACSRPGVVAAAGQLLDPRGTPQTGFAVRRFPNVSALAFESLGWNRLWPSNPVNRRYRCLDFDPSFEQPVEQPAGAFLMVRRSVWEKLGGFDESFFPLWFEEVDFLKRARAAGFLTWYIPEVVAVHHGGHSLSSLSSAASRWYWYDNLLRFSAKHFRPLGFRVVGAAVLVGVAARSVAGVLAGPQPASANGYGRVLRLAVKALVRGRGDAGIRIDRRPDVETITQSNLTNSDTHGL